MISRRRAMEGGGLLLLLACSCVNELEAFHVPQPIYTVSRVGVRRSDRSSTQEASPALARLNPRALRTPGGVGKHAVVVVSMISSLASTQTSPADWSPDDLPRLYDKYGRFDAKSAFEGKNFLTLL